jgi:hypothetical protein
VDPIKAHQTALGADPQTAIRSFRKSLDGLLREAIARLPDALGIAMKADRARLGSNQAAREP